jgi:putative membrane protein
MHRLAERFGLIALALFTAFAIAGFATFGLHPQWLSISPSAPRMYGVAFVLFARGQVVLAAAALFVVLIGRVGWRWLPAFLTVYLVSLASELGGTTLGLPFGPYHYTDGLGPKWFAHVPVLIPLSWFIMALPSYAIARRMVRSRHGLDIAVGSLVLLSWDLALDPAMSHATKYWVWGGSGVYYGMPWLNLVGWFVTGIALMTVFQLLRAERWIVELPIRWLSAFYAVNLALSLGICAAAHLTGAVVASALPLLACFAAARSDPARTRTVEEPTGASARDARAEIA